MIPPEELAAMRERCEKATNPPWVFNPKSTGGEVQPPLASHAESLGALAPMPITTGTPFWSDSDFHFIASARTDLPRLLAEVERLRKFEEAAMAWRDARIAWRVSTDEKRRASHLEALRSEMAIEAALDAAEGGE